MVEQINFLARCCINLIIENYEEFKFTPLYFLVNLIIEIHQKRKGQRRLFVVYHFLSYCSFDHRKVRSLTSFDYNPLIKFKHHKKVLLSV